MRHEPWIALGMSRATWYRLGKPKQKPTPRQTQAKTARQIGISVRTLQRALRIQRYAPELLEQVRAGTLTMDFAELIARDVAARPKG